MMSRQAFAFARDFVPVTVVVVFASFVLWHEPRQSAELERSDGGRGSDLQSPAESRAAVRGLVEAIEPPPTAEPPVAAPGLALLAGFGISALGVLSSLGDRRGHGRMTRAQMRGEMDRRAQALERAEHEIDRLRSSLEARVAERTLALERTVGDLETMNATVSHDLRSPLAAVIHFTAILAEDYDRVLDLPAKDYLRRISSNARTAVSLLDGLLAFSHSGREEMHKTSVDMRRLVEGVRDDLVGKVQPVRGSIEIADLPGAYADPAMIRRVYTNLISNALKCSDACIRETSRAMASDSRSWIVWCVGMAAGSGRRARCGRGRRSCSRCPWSRPASAISAQEIARRRCEPSSGRGISEFPARNIQASVDIEGESRATRFIGFTQRRNCVAAARSRRRRGRAPGAVGAVVLRRRSPGRAPRHRREVALALEEIDPAAFSNAFERCFARVHAHVARHTDNRESLERIVSAVLVENLELLMGRCDEAQEIRRLRRSADRLIALEEVRPKIRRAPQKVSAV